MTLQIYIQMYTLRNYLRLYFLTIECRNFFRPYSPIQNIFFGPLLPRDDRRPIQQRGHNPHQPKQQQQQPLHQQNSKSSIPTNAATDMK